MSMGSLHEHMQRMLMAVETCAGWPYPYVDLCLTRLVVAGIEAVICALQLQRQQPQVLSNCTLCYFPWSVEHTGPTSIVNVKL